MVKTPNGFFFPILKMTIVTQSYLQQTDDNSAGFYQEISNFHILRQFAFSSVSFHLSTENTIYICFRLPGTPKSPGWVSGRDAVFISPKSLSPKIVNKRRFVVNKLTISYYPLFIVKARHDMISVCLQTARMKRQNFCKFWGKYSNIYSAVHCQFLE